MRLIDADALFADLRLQWEQVFAKTKAKVRPEDFFIERMSAFQAASISSDIEAFGDYLNGRPTVDAVPVVRCKDCVYNTAKGLYNHGVNEPICRFSNYPHKADDYCSRGQTMTAEAEEAEADEMSYEWAREEYETPIY